MINMTFINWFRSKIVFITKPSILLLTFIALNDLILLLMTMMYGFNLQLFLQIFLIGVCTNIVIIFKKKICLIIGLIGIIVAFIGYFGSLFSIGGIPVSGFAGLGGLVIMIFEAILLIKKELKKSSKGRIEEKVISQESLEKSSGKQLYASEEEILAIQPTREMEIERFERVATKADFPERWALMYGKKPKEKESFKYFNEIELNMKPMLYHPNYFHLNLINYLEDLSYRIEENNPPINEIHNSSYLTSTLLDGSIKASIRTSRKSLGTPKMLLRLIFGIFFLVFSIISVIITLEYFNSPDEYFLKLLFFSFFFISLATSLILLLPYIIDLIKGNKLNGYSNIYVLERGITYTGMKQEEKKMSETTETQKMPLIATKLTISIAGAVKLMSADRLKEDIKKLSKTIEDLYNSIQ